MGIIEKIEALYDVEQSIDKRKFSGDYRGGWDSCVEKVLRIIKTSLSEFTIDDLKRNPFYYMGFLVGVEANTWFRNQTNGISFIEKTYMIGRISMIHETGFLLASNSGNHSIEYDQVIKLMLFNLNGDNDG